MKRRSAASGAAGFTLIELLVTLALLALISLLLFNGIRFGARVWESGSARLNAAEEISAAQNILRQLLEQAALPRPPIVATGRSEPSFQGTDGSLRFIAPLPVHRGIGGLYGLTLAKNGTDLVLAWQARRLDSASGQNATDPANSSPLLSGIAAVTLSYYGAVGQGRRPAWYSTWDDRAGLPELVRVEIAFAPGDRRVWPALIAAVKGPATPVQAQR